MFSFDHATGVMYTCDAFGAHYATGAPFDTELQALAPHFRFYYDCLMRPNARSVLTALRKVKDLDYTTVATGHGPIIRYNLEELVGRWVKYISWRLASLSPGSAHSIAVGFAITTVGKLSAHRTLCSPATRQHSGQQASAVDFMVCCAGIAIGARVLRRPQPR